MKNLFDMAHANAMSLISIQEDKDFSKAQREPSRSGSLGTMDIKMAATEARWRQLEHMGAEFEANQIILRGGSRSLSSRLLDPPPSNWV